MKKVILLFILILGLTQGVKAQENAEAKNQRIGFAGIITSATSEMHFGGGIEVGTFKKGVGIGFQAEYIPSIKPSLETSTFARLFFLLKITDKFFIKPSLGVEAKNLGRREDFHNENSFNFGIGPLFTLEKTYLGIQSNLSYSYNGLNFSTGSIVVGIIFK